MEEKQRLLGKESTNTYGGGADGFKGRRDGGHDSDDGLAAATTEQQRLPLPQERWSYRAPGAGATAAAVPPLSPSAARSGHRPILPSLLPMKQQDAASKGGNGGGRGRCCGCPSRSVPSASAGRYLSYVIYAIVNVIISLPGLYGYAAVIFSHPAYADHMNALSKLVIFSSAVHQLGFFLFSSLPFAIGTVQDAGLIFLSSMSTTIADKILDSGGTHHEVISTAVVLLSLGTFALGLVLVLMGHFRLADAVSYLPMPVVGGYLAFIGYFCLQAGTALCISENMESVADWVKAVHGWKLAIPGLISGLLLTFVSRYGNTVALPLTMVAIPAAFYAYIAVTGIGLDGARDGGWVGEVSDPVPVSDLFALVDLTAVHWKLVANVLMTWTGMVFVVSFASCLDVAAIAMDMGVPLDTNNELKTVGYCNVMSGITLGYTGSYIFSQTIFTYRTGVHSKMIGVLIIFVFCYVVLSPVNILQVAPLFFLGSTLIFIGYDLLLEWLFEVRTKIFLSEYCIVWATFVAIQVVGIDFGIVIGILVSVVDHVVSTATETTVNRAYKVSRAVWSPEEFRILQNVAYRRDAPQIVTLEVVGSVFFGSSLYLLQRLCDEVGIDLQVQDVFSDLVTATPSRAFRSPGTPALLYQVKNQRRVTGTTPNTGDGATTTSTTTNNSTRHTQQQQTQRPTVLRPSPKFVVLDLSRLGNLDATAARGCFLQLIKMCFKKKITVCAAGATPRTEWMLRSHDVALSVPDETKLKADFHSRKTTSRNGQVSEQQQPKQQQQVQEHIIMFLTVYEALEMCEHSLLRRMNLQHSGPFGGFYPDTEQHPPTQGQHYALSRVFARLLSATQDEFRILETLDELRFHEELTLNASGELFPKHAHSDCFYAVLKGSTAVALDDGDVRRRVYRDRTQILSGAGRVRNIHSGSGSKLLDPQFMESQAESTNVSVNSIWPVGGVVGFVDFLLERPRSFRAVAAQDGTVVAKITNSHLNVLQREEPELYNLVQRVLLQASVIDLANCTCDE